MLTRIIKRVATVIREEWQWFKFHTWKKNNVVRFMR